GHGEGNRESRADYPCDAVANRPAALKDQTDWSFLQKRHGSRKTPQSFGQRKRSHAIRAANDKTGAIAQFPHGPPSFFPLRIVAFAETGAVDGRGLRAQLRRFFDRAENGPRRNEHQQVLGHLWQSRQVRITFIVKYLRIVRIDQIDFAWELRRLEIAINTRRPAPLG